MNGHTGIKITWQVSCSEFSFLSSSFPFQLKKVELSHEERRKHHVSGETEVMADSPYLTTILSIHKAIVRVSQLLCMVAQFDVFD
jgi:hypothetical protein